MWRHYVYIHKKADSGEVFYVGKGSLRTRRKATTPERAYATVSRSAWWQRTVEAHGLTVEIFASCMSDADAQNLERSLITSIGRRDLDSGPLVNLTDGGDGHSGILVRESTREKRRASARGPRPAAWIASIRKARAGGGNGGVVRQGDRLPDRWRTNIAAGKVGERNPMFGRTGADHPNSRRVIDTATGDVFPSVTAAADARGIRMKALYNVLSGHRPNRTTLRFA